ncbi:hypothetical protein [Saccharopolyspora rectivirgula]|jgi:hypothetical protein|uniref:Small secreted protein n=1 Tax=Saccharopolyspora rectivirgula TaxID=28042 RepID=A0A073AXD0_9PSEU|nr:hypothetical protein [Saccharopolyspora rectivirgula]KEI43707.1 hypothetical protein GU90_15410 [Saccharopolyspora rectivirgula]
MKFRSTAIAALTALPLALGACGQGQDGSGQQQQQQQQEQQQEQQQQDSAQAAQPSPEGVAWMGELCGLVGQFSQAQQNLPEVDRTNTETFKNSALGQIDVASRAADDTVRGLQQMGPSPLEGGDQVNDSFERKFTEVRDILFAAKGKAEQVDVSTQESFQQGMTEVQQELKKGEQLDFNEQLDALESNPELRSAVQQAPQCQIFLAPPEQQQPPQPEQPQQPR